jgi:hypothetical protein
VVSHVTAQMGNKTPGFSTHNVPITCVCPGSGLPVALGLAHLSAERVCACGKGRHQSRKGTGEKEQAHGARAGPRGR